MASSPSSPHSSFDVFLSFRGEDTRKTIVSHLYAALDGKGINTFKDDRGLQTGDHISNELLRAIEGSTFAVVVLSKNYVTSSWCLMELQSIMALYKLRKIKVFPIFYEVDPSDVRHQRESFSLSGYQDVEKVLKWKEALSQVAGLSGVDSRDCADEAKMLEDIVENISSQLAYRQATHLEDVFGVETIIEQMKPLLKIESDQEVRIIGIWGMGGIGKTTIAKCLYEQFGRQFPARCFIENVDKNCKEDNLISVQERFLCSVLSIKRVALQNEQHGATVIKSRLRALRVFVVLDGVETEEQLNALAKETSWFGHGSRIIITTRDKSCLASCRVNSLHKVRCLERDVSVKMLKHFAFKDGVPPEDDAYEGLVIRASQLAQGLPFALLAFSSYLRRISSIEEWEDALVTFETAPPPRIMDVVKSSYTNLDSRSKTIFLKVACLFNGDPLRPVCILLDETETRIKTLADTSLIQISNDGVIDMHSLIQQVGREIILEESNHIPRQQKLLWNHLTGYDLLKSKTGTREVEGMALHICQLPPEASPIDGSAFGQMHNLTFLKLFKHMDDMESKLDLTSNNVLFPQRLRLLHWDAYPLTTLPPRLPLDYLVEIHLRHSNLESLWDGSPTLSKLRKLDVTESKNLKRLPHFTNARRFEELITKGCTRLERFPETIGRVPRLKKLDVSQCDCLMKLEMIIGELPPLRTDTGPREYLEGTPRVAIFRQVAVEIPDSFDTIDSLTDISVQGKLSFRLLQLRGKAAHLSFSSEHRVPSELMTKQPYPYGTESEFHGFKSLDIMRFSYKSDGLPFEVYSFSSFPCLLELNLINLNIKTIPSDIGLLRRLQKLDLTGNDFTHLPTEMENLCKMKSLRLCNCSNLQKLPHLTQLDTLQLSECNSSLQLFPDAKEHGIRYLLQKLWVNNCKAIPNLSDMLSHCPSLTHLDLSRSDISAMPASIRLSPLLRTLVLNDCKKLKSLSQVSKHLTSLYASGCSTLGTISLPTEHSLIHLDLSYCPHLNGVEELINRFLTGGQSQEVSLRFACLPGSKVPSYFDKEATRSPQVWHASESVGFDACIIVSCESPFHLQFPSSSYTCQQKHDGSHRVNLRPDFIFSSESCSGTNEGEVVASDHHMLIFHVPVNVDVHTFHLETHLEFSGEFQTKPARIISSSLRVIPKPQESSG